MDKFLKYLYSIGYKVYNYAEKEIEMPANWSCHGPDTVFLVKDNDFDNKIYWGICRGLIIENTATLRYPLPFKGNGGPDDEEKTVSILKNTDPEQVYKLMYDQPKILI